MRFMLCHRIHPGQLQKASCAPRHAVSSCMQQPAHESCHVSSSCSRLEFDVLVRHCLNIEADSCRQTSRFAVCLIPGTQIAPTVHLRGRCTHWGWLRPPRRLGACKEWWSCQPAGRKAMNVTARWHQAAVCLCKLGVQKPHIVQPQHKDSSLFLPKEGEQSGHP